ncbi:MAG: HEAT repeat domain-containing protein, partial [Longimicrobiales bacterium]
AAVRFSFESKPGVCGDGENIRVRRTPADAVSVAERGREYTINSGRTYRDRLQECIEGPVHVELERADGRITAARVRVGGAARTDGIDLGDVDPAAAVAFMLDGSVLRDARGRAADRMVFAATLARAESWPLLLRAARMQELPAGARKSAVFWLAQEASEKAAEGLGSIVGNDSDELEVRKQAVFALSQIRSDASIDTLIEIARTNREPEIRKNAMFWLGQSGDPRALAFFEEVLRG